MKISLLIVLLVLIGFGGGVLAQEAREPVPLIPEVLPELPGAGFTPESRFYFLDQWGEGIQMFFTFTDEGKARLQVSLIGERVSEIKVMLGREVLSPGAIEIAFVRIGAHTDRAAIILGELEARAEIAPLAATLANKMSVWEGFLNDAIENSGDKIRALAVVEREALLQRMDDPNFIQAMENALRGLADEIDAKLGRPLEGFTVVSYNVDVDDDTYSSTHEAEADTIVDLAALRNRILAQGIDQAWESGDVTLDDDSLDITFEKVYPPVTIDGIELTPEASVTISVSINSPQQGMTSIDYDIDITLETESERLASFLEDKLDKAEEEFDDLSDEIEEQMEVSLAARKAIQEAEEAKQEIIDEAAEEGIVIPAGTFDEFDALLMQARSALAAGNYQEARRFAEQAEEILDDIEEAIKNLEKEKEEAIERLEELEEKLEEAGRAEEALREVQRKLEQAPIEAREEIEKELEEARKQYQERLKEIEEAREKVEEEMPEAEMPARERGRACQKDRDCIGLICPMVIGGDTPQCDEETEVCFCGPSWTVNDRMPRPSNQY